MSKIGHAIGQLCSKEKRINDGIKSGNLRMHHGADSVKEFQMAAPQ